MGGYVARTKDMAEPDATPSDVPDVLAPDLRIVFVGINPGRVSAAARAHFANPRNDFWRLLHAAQLTSRLFEPTEQFSLLEERIGVTNAAYRTTPGSSDLRRADFAGSEARLERIARELHPSWLAFVGKEAYRGAFGARPELGLQQQALGSTKLFVLPSTSPANAAVPWDERLRWFRELAGRESGLPERETVRAAVVDERGRTLLLRYGDDYGQWWTTPGGGREEGESDEQTLRRELEEEVGLVDFELGPLLWELRGWTREEIGYGSFFSRAYLVHVDRFEPPHVTEGQEARWFSPAELTELSTRPPDLAERLSRSSGS
ncbi:MAG TPA: NUDIX domain-containing protein, partial [Gaiellaceae bacterium]